MVQEELTDLGEACDHGVHYDEEEARRLMASEGKGGAQLTAEIRERWPRVVGKCPKGCGLEGIFYASFAHYIAGDW